MIYEIEVTPPQRHEIVTALHRNRNKLWQRVRHTEKQLIELKSEDDPSRRLYLETIKDLRLDRIAKIDDLLKTLEPIKENGSTEK